MLFGLAFIVVAAVVMAQTLFDPGSSTFYHRTVGCQIDRDSPFSIWGQVNGLEPLRIAAIVALGVLAVFLVPFARAARASSRSRRSARRC